jgi:hypothetical protein
MPVNMYEEYIGKARETLSSIEDTLRQVQVEQLDVDQSMAYQVVRSWLDAARPVLERPGLYEFERIQYLMRGIQDRFENLVEACEHQLPVVT